MVNVIDWSAAFINALMSRDSRLMAKALKQILTERPLFTESELVDRIVLTTPVLRKYMCETYVRLNGGFVDIRLSKPFQNAPPILISVAMVPREDDLPKEASQQVAKLNCLASRDDCTRGARIVGIAVCGTNAEVHMYTAGSAACPQ